MLRTGVQFGMLSLTLILQLFLVVRITGNIEFFEVEAYLLSSFSLQIHAWLLLMLGIHFYAQFFMVLL